MKQILLTAVTAAFFATAATVGQAQSATLSVILDTNVTAQAFSATYVPVSNKFLVGGSASVQVFNGITGAPEGSLDLTGITPAGLGFFALTADDAGAIFANEDGAKDLWRWSSVTDTAPVKVNDSPLFARVGDAASSGTGAIVAFTGSADNSFVEFFKSDGTLTSFPLSEAPDLDGKNALAMNSDGTVIYTCGGTTTAAPLTKWVKTGGVWTQDTTPWTNPVTGGGPVAFDEVNNIVFILGIAAPTTIKALNGTTGVEIGNATVTNTLNGTPGYNGARVEATAGSGIASFAGRLLGGSAVAGLWKVSYTTTANVKDFMMY